MNMRLPFRSTVCLLACASAGPVLADTGPQSAARACSLLADSELAARLPVPRTVVLSAALVEATAALPEHCLVDGEINRRIGIDNQSYATRFRLRLPTRTWNGRLFMGGGGGTNGVLVDPVPRLAQGYATLGTDGGHDNAKNNRPEAGGTSSFGVDPDARIDFAYRAYDQVTKVGKALLQRFYERPPAHSYFVGCSEGGREAMLMTQRFPQDYDGVVAGDPVLHIPLGPLSGLYTTQLFAAMARRNGLVLGNGEPAIARTYSDGDLLLMRNAVLAACDGLDGLVDGIVDNLQACTPDLVARQLAAIQCDGAKTDRCLSKDQIETMKTAYAGAVNSKGEPLYSDWQWDAGMGGIDGNAYNQAWRSWWLGSFSAPVNNAIKLTFATAEAVIYTTPPKIVPTRASLDYALAYDFDTEPSKLLATTAQYRESTAVATFADSPDLEAFRDRGGKMMLYQGASDSSVSVKDTLRWLDAMRQKMGSGSPDFARMFIVPGMGHCGGGPATDRFDMLPQLVDWVEKGVSPDSVQATASHPGYFGVTARSRPLCPYPKQTRYKGQGDINVASSFECR